ncbi:MAG TPA: hypothetical protein VFD43_05560 [Planctomycetota bacterium]|nr:hypothetical protein [Planctomycetota bacterium]
MDRELRRLIVVGAALAVALFTGRAVIGALWDADDAGRQASAMRAKLRAGAEAGSRPSREDLAEVTRLREELSARLEQLLPALAYSQPAEFGVGPGESPDLRYIEVVRREQELLVKGAAFAGQAVPGNLGLPELNPTGLEDVLRTLRSLHVAHVVVSAALAAGVDSIDAIKMPTAARKQRSESGFLRTHRVEFELAGAPRAVRDALAAIAAGTPYLALDDVRIESKDEDGAKVVCRFAASAVLVDAEQPVLAAEQG